MRVAEEKAVVMRLLVILSYLVSYSPAASSLT